MAKPPKTRCGGQWTEARFFSFIRSALRRSSSRWAPAFACLRAAETGKKVNEKTGRIAMHYRCSECGNELPRKEVAIDHIVEAGTLRSFDDLPGFAERLFCEADGFQILCVPCHAIKTNEAKKK